MIIQEITINQVHPIVDGQKLSDLNAVNFIIGKNGTGKSRVLNKVFEIISGTSQNNGQLDIKYKEEEISITKIYLPDKINPFFIDLQAGEQKIPTGIYTRKIAISTNPISRTRNNETGSMDMKINSFFQAARKLIGKKNAKIQETEIHITGTLKKIPGEPIIEVEGGHVVDKYEESRGTAALTAYMQYIQEIIAKSGKNIIFIEEPENSLHPTAQKELVKYITQIIPTFRRVQFFITTHSPFIIGAADTSISNFYTVDDGRINMERSTVAMSRMLGADPTDVGLPKNIVLTSELSINDLLSHLQTKNLISKDYYFISVQGDPKIEPTSAHLQTMSKLFETSPLYSSSYYFIADNSEDKDINKSYNKLLLSIKDRFIELERSSLEECYVQWEVAQDIYEMKYKSKIQQSRYPEKGELKCQCAKDVAEKLCEDGQNFKINFSALFNNKLDFLLNVK